MHNFPQYLKTWARGNPSCIGDDDDLGRAQRSVIWQAFSASRGALYEPTPGLHRLLDDAYCVFRTNVTGRFGMVTGDFGNVTGHFGNVTERTGRQDWRCA